MRRPIRRRAANTCAVVLSAWLASSCGGGATDASTASTETPMAARLPPLSAAGALITSELMRNGRFDDGLAGWTVGDAGLVASQLRPGGRALNVGWQVVQNFAATTLAPKRAYTLTVVARNDKPTGSAELAIKFRRPAGAEVFRTYRATVASNAYQTYTLDFTAPAYTALADFSITANGTRVVVDSVSLKPRSAIAQTEAIVSPVGSYVPTGYVLAFNDEFNGTALNRSKWFTRYLYAGETMDRLNDEQQRYRDNDNHRVAGGVLSLVARKVSANDPDGVNYESGMIRSDWTAREGYYEARVKMPGGVGVWPAFWLNSDVSSAGRLAWPPEIDIFEFVNNGVEDRVDMLHSNVRTHPGAVSQILYADPAFNTTWSYYAAPFNFNEAWHTIGAAWDATTVTVYVDGRKIYTRGYTWTEADGTPAGPAHILLNLAVGGSWAGRHGIDDAAFPQALQVDWVRAYTRKP